ncbi:hypothetical protein MTR67_021677 [Solanum verrucosum]|uniref:CSD domain-containing protein n=1 Tax=Solanum verrucosum TaxID=315347 RepID=A0AAF0QTB4_SOLVR|nr:hypothetical protein MTR67_021677 [Solanum verrucosum]
MKFSLIEPVFTYASPILSPALSSISYNLMDANVTFSTAYVLERPEEEVVPRAGLLLDPKGEQIFMSFFLIPATYFLVAVTVPKGTDKGIVRENGQRAKGTVKWFSDDLFAHQSGIRSECSQSLSEGETVEFEVESGSNSRTKPVDVNWT